MEIPGIEPKLTIRKIVVLPFKLYPPKISFTYLIDTVYPRNDLNVHDLHQQSLKLSCLPIPALGYIIAVKARVIRTPN